MQMTVSACPKKKRAKDQIGKKERENEGKDGEKGKRKVKAWIASLIQIK